jgi:hypothetical protein
MRGDDQDKSADAPPDAKGGPVEKAFLGPEFLTWLFFYLEENQLEVEVDGRVVGFSIGRRLVLSTLDNTGVRTTLAGPDLDDSGELLQAVRRGALIEHLSLQMALGERVYELTLNGKDGGVASLKIPELFSKDDEVPTEEDTGTGKAKRSRKPDAGDILSLRMMCLEEVEEILDGLFARFVTRRLARAWVSEDIRSMRKMVAAGLAARLAGPN